MKRYNLYRVHFVDASSVADTENIGVYCEYGTRNIARDLNTIKDAMGNCRLIGTPRRYVLENEIPSDYMLIG